ncbi:MAG: tetratricopeptide repeat protein [Flavobacteriales bacterium]|nr:tetratricopeptide repeat protein [Flavobacteriales bacterium]
MKLFFYITTIILLSFLGCSAPKNVENNIKEPKKSKSKNLSDLSEKEKMNYDFMFHNANKERILGNYQIAAGLFTQCIQLAPSEPAAYYEVAKIFDHADQKQLALENARKSVELDGDNYWYRYFYAYSLQKSGDTENAIKQYEKLIELNPENVELYYDLAGMQLYTSQYPEAIKSYNKLEEKIGVSEEISLQKQKVYIKLNDIDKAAAEVQKLINKYPDDTKYQGYLADLYLANNLNEKAFKIYQQILEKDSTDSFSHLGLYDYYRNIGDKEKAYKEIKYVFENEDFDIDSKMQILLSYYAFTENDSELKKEAFELSKVLIKTHPTEAKAFTIYGDFLYREKKIESAKENYLKAIELDSSKFAIWSQVLLIDAELQNYDDLLIHSKSAIDLFPNQPMFYFFYGVANMQKKNYQEAADYFVLGKDFVIDNPPLLAQFYANLGDSYNQLKQYKESDNSYEKALEIEPRNIFVLNNYGYYLSLREENLERAEQLSALANEIEPNQPNYEDTYAWILYKQGKYVAAKEWLEKAIANGGDKNAVILEHLGDVHAKLNNIDKALELWNAAKLLGEGTDLLDKKIEDKKLYE